MVRRLIQTAIFIFITLTSGCWDLRGVERLALATTIGIDREPADQIRVTIQLPLIQNLMPPGFRGGSETQFSLASIKGVSVNSAFERLQTKSQRELVIAQNKSIIIGTPAAEQDMRSILDFLTRDAQAPPQALVMVADGDSAAQVLAMQSATRILPGVEFFLAAQLVENYDRTYFIPIWEFHQKLDHEAKDPYAPLIGIDRKENRYIQSGLAAFSADRLAGKLSSEETQIFGILANLMQAGHLDFRLPTGEAITLRNVQARTKLTVVKANSLPHFIVRTKLKASVTEWTGAKEATRQTALRHLEQKIASQIEAGMGRVIRKLQKYNSDIINFGEALRVQDQRLWKKIQWRKTYPKVPFKVKVTVQLVSNGVIR